MKTKIIKRILFTSLIAMQLAPAHATPTKKTESKTTQAKPTAILTPAPPTPEPTQKQCTHKKKKRSQSFLKDYLTIATLSSATGAATGAACAYCEKYFNININSFSLQDSIIPWFLFSKIRNSVIHGINGTAKIHGVKVNRVLAPNTAQLTDWITYLYFKMNR